MLDIHSYATVIEKIFDFPNKIKKTENYENFLKENDLEDNAISKLLFDNIKKGNYKVDDLFVQNIFNLSFIDIYLGRFVVEGEESDLEEFFVSLGAVSLVYICVGLVYSAISSLITFLQSPAPTPPTPQNTFKQKKQRKSILRNTYKDIITDDIKNEENIYDYLVKDKVSETFVESVETFIRNVYKDLGLETVPSLSILKNSVYFLFDVIFKFLRSAFVNYLFDEVRKQGIGEGFVKKLVDYTTLIFDKFLYKLQQYLRFRIIEKPEAKGDFWTVWFENWSSFVLRNLLEDAIKEVIYAFRPTLDVQAALNYEMPSVGKLDVGYIWGDKDPLEEIRKQEEYRKNLIQVPLYNLLISCFYILRNKVELGRYYWPVSNEKNNLIDKIFIQKKNDKYFLNLVVPPNELKSDIETTYSIIELPVVDNNLVRFLPMLYWVDEKGTEKNNKNKGVFVVSESVKKMFPDEINKNLYPFLFIPVFIDENFDSNGFGDGKLFVTRSEFQSIPLPKTDRFWYHKTAFDVDTETFANLQLSMIFSEDFYSKDVLKFLHTFFKYMQTTVGVGAMNLIFAIDFGTNENPTFLYNLFALTISQNHFSIFDPKSQSKRDKMDYVFIPLQDLFYGRSFDQESNLPFLPIPNYYILRSLSISYINEMIYNYGVWFSDAYPSPFKVSIALERVQLQRIVY
ncbi:MAG: hypothetical protein NZM44_06485 [Candidatus Calescibacterium sp.]|nr:hypothetical protein [Candidatus Calescibacterium sp.]